MAIRRLTSGINLPALSATPSTPASGSSLYAKTDGRTYALDASGIETQVSGKAFGSWHQSSANAQTIGTTQTAIQINTTRLVSAAADFTLASSVLTVNRAGTYELTVKVSCPSGTASARVFARVESFTSEAVGGGTLLLDFDAANTHGTLAGTASELHTFAASTKLRMFVYSATAISFAPLTAGVTSGGWYNGITLTQR